MVEHALRFVERVVFVVGERNLRSQKALEKIGARFLKKAELPAPDGTLRRNVIFAITREDSPLRLRSGQAKSRRRS